jgi:hypothetical protein
VTYAEPKLNELGFPTTNGGSALLAYQVEWDTTRNFNSGVGGQPLGAYQARTVSGDGVDNHCQGGNCVLPALGAEVQEVLVYSGTGTIIGGGFVLGFDGAVTSTCVSYGETSANVALALQTAGTGDVSVSREAITSPGNGFRYLPHHLFGLVREPAAGAARRDGERRRGLRLAQ